MAASAYSSIAAAKLPSAQRGLAVCCRLELQPLCPPQAAARATRRRGRRAAGSTPPFWRTSACRASAWIDEVALRVVVLRGRSRRSSSQGCCSGTNAPRWRRLAPSRERTMVSLFSATRSASSSELAVGRQRSNGDHRQERQPACSRSRRQSTARVKLRRKAVRCASIRQPPSQMRVALGLQCWQLWAAAAVRAAARRTGERTRRDLW
jgi:hypothetical protein